VLNVKIWKRWSLGAKKCFYTSNFPISLRHPVSSKIIQSFFHQGTLSYTYFTSYPISSVCLFRPVFCNQITNVRRVAKSLDKGDHTAAQSKENALQYSLWSQRGSKRVTPEIMHLKSISTFCCMICTLHQIIAVFLYD
jgi:hypothetical protein